MSKEAFAKKFAEDKEFAEKVFALDTLEDAKAFNAKEGFEFSDEEITAFLAEMAKLKDETMSDDDLDLAVGGFMADGLFLSSADAEKFREGVSGLLLEGSFFTASGDDFRSNAGIR